MENLLDYRNDPRAILCHEGNKNSGRYPRGSGERPYQHEGRRFGKAKYQNPDGSLTKRGEARFEAEKRKNALKKKENRVKDLDDLRDPARWDREDTENRKGIVDASSKLVSELQKLENKSGKKKKKTFDLSNMSDAELRSFINRMQMEDQYSRLMSERDTEVSKGRITVHDILDVAGDALAVGSSAIAIALAIKQLKG